MDRFNKQLLSTYSVPSTVLGTGLIEMDGTCSQLQRNSQPNRAKCHITKSMHVKCYHKGKEQWSQHRDRSYRLSLERYTSVSRSLYLAPDFPKLQWLPLAKLKSPKSSLRFFPSNELRAINQYPFPFPWQAFLWANPLLEKAVNLLTSEDTTLTFDNRNMAVVREQRGGHPLDGCKIWSPSLQLVNYKLNKAVDNLGK